MQVGKLTKFFIRALKKVKALKYINLYPRAHSDQGGISLPIIGETGFHNLFDEELFLQDVLAQILPLKKGAFIDVGVYTGQTLLKLLACDRSRTYLGFEPNYLCCAYVFELIRLNRLSNCQIFQFGLGDTQSVERLQLRDKYDGYAKVVSLNQPNTDNHLQHLVPIYQGDQLLETLGQQQIGFIKIDAEGMELEVVKGFLATIRRDKPYIISEVFAEDKKEGQPSLTDDAATRRLQALEDILREENYTIFQVSPAGQLRVQQQLRPPVDQTWREHLFVPANEVDQLPAALIDQTVDDHLANR